MAKIMMRQRLKLAVPEVLSRGLVVLFPEPMNQKAEVFFSDQQWLQRKRAPGGQLLQEDIEPGTLILTMEDEQKLKIWEDFLACAPGLPLYGLCGGERRYSAPLW